MQMKHRSGVNLRGAGAFARGATIVIAGFLVAGPAAGQGAAAIPAFEKATWTSPQSFTSITDVRELSDGRVLVIDFGEMVLRLLDARGGRGYCGARGAATVVT
jgi:hypothetical protein